ncbi:hypothetical protein EVAR_47741_1 [Eumeta japonica]|uniref:RNA-directed DNA polymerase from mobile element jockey n=1 Tax=Eumeta variegata TaxID=151549 RepID=A0A4C1VTG9_EUMVA|nr:hypothetical protein EVAR_47741_1 [Eumeta japonica]
MVRGRRDLQPVWVYRRVQLLEYFYYINNLLLGEKKTKLVQFFLISAKPVNGNVKIKDRILGIVDTTLFLGFTLDAKLPWNSHITRLTRRLSLQHMQ